MDSMEMETGEITLMVDGAPLVLKLTVPAVPVTAHVMLPVFQQLTNAFTDIGIKASEKNGNKISCKKGCGACCCQPVPLAEIEVYHIANLVKTLEEPRRSEILQRFEAGAAHFEKTGWFEKIKNCQEEEEVKQTVLEYFFQGVPCPFLEKGSCSIYEQRPIACREYLVTSPAGNCSNPIAEHLSPLKLAINASNGVRQLSSGVSLPKQNFIVFIQALRLAKAYPENVIEKTGAAWLAEFFG